MDPQPEPVNYICGGLFPNLLSLWPSRVFLFFFSVNINVCLGFENEEWFYVCVYASDCGMENMHCRISTANNKDIFPIHVPSIEILTAMHVFSFEPFKPFNPGHIPFTILPRRNDQKLRDINLISIWCYVPDNKPPFATVMIKMCRFDIPVMFSLWLRFTMTRGRKSTLWLRFFYNRDQTFGLVPICLSSKPEAKWGKEPLSNLLPVLLSLSFAIQSSQVNTSLKFWVKGSINPLCIG